MKTYTLPKRTILLWRLRVTLLCSILIFLFLRLPLNSIWNWFLCGLVFLIFIFLNFWYLPKFIKSCKITVSDGSVIIKRGVIIENCHILPFSRLIHTQTIATPLARLFSLETVLLKAARFRIFVPELSFSDAQDLIEEVSSLEETL